MWQRYASPVWATLEGEDGYGMLAAGQDINPSDTLQHRSAREDADERHICPLQLEVSRRCIRLWSNPGEIVWSPFAGIGSEGYVALEEGRRFIGAELKQTYYEQAVRNLIAAESPAQSTLFDLVNQTQEAM
jgi:DNA modification methylase